MASKKFISEQMIKLERNYGSDRFKITQQMFDLWTEMFKDYSEEGFKVSVDEYIKTSEYPPTVASISKIYKEKEAYREELRSYLKNKYIWVSKWYEEEPTQEGFLEFCRYIMKFPKNDRMAKADEVTRKAISFYNNKQNQKTFKEYLEGLL